MECKHFDSVHKLFNSPLFFRNLFYRFKPKQSNYFERVNHADNRTLCEIGFNSYNRIISDFNH